MMDIWSWICELPNSDEWSSSNSSKLVLELATAKPARLIQLTAERTSGSGLDTFVTFAICLEGFHSINTQKTIWVSNTFPLKTDKPFLPLLLQLLQEIISRSPTAHNTTCPRSQHQTLKPDAVSWIMDSHSPESFSNFFNLILLTRLFWLCMFDAPSDVGSFYFESLLSANLDAFSSKNAPVLRKFLLTVGVDVELCFTRAVGYMLAKWLISREVGVGLQQALTSSPSSKNLGFSYATEAHGFWMLKGYAPVLGMKVTRSPGPKYQFPLLEAKDSVLRYALAHQQLEAVIQLEYSVGFYYGFIHVGARVDNLRFHVTRLRYNKDDDDEVEFSGERHFVSRVRVWVGPEVGENYVSGLSLGLSTENTEREVKIQKNMKSSYGKAKVPRVKLSARMSTRTKMKNWRWDQEAEGNAAVFHAVMYDNVTGNEVANRRLESGGKGVINGIDDNEEKRYSGVNRGLSKKGGLVFAGDEYGEEVGWRIGKEMEGSVLKWRIGAQIWLSYCPNDVKSQYFETRRVDWCDEVDLPLIPPKLIL